MNGKLVLSILLVVFIDLLGLSLMIPLLPQYALDFGASETTTGFLFAAYALMQMLGAPVLGRLSDRHGRRPVLLVSIVGTAIGFVLLGVANSLAMLFVARVVSGASAGNLSVAQAYISDVTDARNRARGLGLIGAAFGLGFIFGPATGGILAGLYGLSVPAFAAAALCALNLALVAFWLPESLSHEERRARRAAGAQAGGFSFGALARALSRPFTGSLLVTRGGVTLAFGMVQTVSGLYMIRKFQMTPTEIAYVLTYVGVLMVIVQGAVAGRVIARVRDDVLIAACVALLGASMLGWAVAPTLLAFNLNQVPMALAGGLLATLMSSTLTKSVEPHEVGGILGLGSAIDSAMRAVSPLIGGAILERFGTAAPGGFGAIVLLVTLGYVYAAVYNHPVALRLRAAPAYSGRVDG